jgi:hypothetical protein
MAVLWEIDPPSEDASNVPLSLVGTVGGVQFKLTDMDLTPPEIDPIYAAPADTTEGESVRRLPLRGTPRAPRRARCIGHRAKAVQMPHRPAAVSRL